MNAQFRPTGECLCNQTHTQRALEREHAWASRRERERDVLLSRLSASGLTHTRPQQITKKEEWWASEWVSEWIARSAHWAFSWEYSVRVKNWLRLLHPSRNKTLHCKKLHWASNWLQKTGFKCYEMFCNRTKLLLFLKNILMFMKWQLL